MSKEVGMAGAGPSKMVGPVISGLVRLEAGIEHVLKESLPQLWDRLDDMENDKLKQVTDPGYSRRDTSLDTVEAKGSKEHVELAPVAERIAVLCKKCTEIRDEVESTSLRIANLNDAIQL